jgi:hypothetical protein
MVLAGLSLVASVAAAPRVVAQAEAASTGEPAAGVERRRIDGMSLGGFVLPTKPVDGGCSISATEVWRWKSDDTQRLYLEGDVRISVGGYSFSARRATVWINRLPLSGGAATQMAIWFERADEPTRRAGLGASGRDLLVTAAYLGPTKLASVVDRTGGAPERPFIRAGESRLAAYLGKLVRDTEAGKRTLRPFPELDARTKPDEPMPVPGGSIAEAVAQAPAPATSIDVPTGGGAGLPIFRPDGIVSFSADSVVLDEKLNRVAVQGMVEIEYLGELDGEDRSLHLSAERGVLFLAPGALAALREGTRSLEAGAIEGIYLEGAVHASDGQYALRGAQIYYDLAGNRAIIVDAVLRTYDRLKRDMPIYTRAAELRQVAADEWVAERASVSTSEFFTPHLSIGVDKVTVTRQPEDGQSGGGLYVKADGAAIEASGTRILPLPGYEGEVDSVPLRSLRTGYDDDRGPILGTSWDLLALAGADPVDGLDAELDVDAFFTRGLGLGTTFTLSKDLGSGIVDLYGLYDTGGEDRTSAGVDVEVDPSFRGVADAEWQMALAANTNLQTQFAYVSDETFISTWRQQDFATRREYETSVYLNNVKDNSALSLLLKYDLNEFISNSYLLASRSYTVEKLPELGYRRYGDEILEGFTWSQQYNANLMQLRPTSGTPDSLGVPVGAWGGAIAANEDIESAFFDGGYRDNLVSRLDTRHELSLPLASDSATLTPFVTGQATGYFMDEFSAYSSDADELRFQSGGGARASMRFVRVDDSVQSRLLDLNRMRHIVEPYSVAWAGWDSVEEGAYPIYDQDYEGATGGAAFNLGLRNVLQTQRGGAGAWQSVDWVKLDTGLVVNDGGSDFQPEPIDPLNPAGSLRWAQSPIPAFYSFRPELSQWGSHAYGLLTWQLSDAFSVGGTANYLFEDRAFVTDDDALLPNLARGSLGAEMRHSPVLSTYLEYRYLAPTATELLQAGVIYRLGQRYVLACSPQYDLLADDFRAISGSLTRTFPDYDLSLTAGYDRIEDDAFFGLSLSIPAGSGGALRRTNFGSYTPTMGAAPGYTP